MTNLEQAQQLAGRHYYCEDCWYSCPKAEDGCCDKSQGTECNCGYEKRVQSIASALDAAEQRGLPSEIECPACGETVKQVSSATLSIALWQHWNWTCPKRAAEQRGEARGPQWQPIDGVVGCLDCGLPYEQFAMDTHLPRAQWLAIHPDEHGVLCAQCVLKRAAQRLPGATVAHVIFEVSPWKQDHGN